MLPDAGHLKIALGADQISKMPAARLAEVICQNAGAPRTRVRLGGRLRLDDDDVAER
jgi:hypothetical protein